MSPGDDDDPRGLWRGIVAAVAIELAAALLIGAAAWLALHGFFG